MDKPEGDQTTGTAGTAATNDTNTGSSAGTDKDAAYWQAEARKAFEARDKVKAQLRDLEGRVLSDEDRATFDKLKRDAAELDEKRKRADGQYEALKQELVAKHTAELEAAKKRAAELEATIRDREITAAFASASDWFGPTGKTILPPAVAQSHLARYCEVQDGKIVVKRPDGTTIHGADGNPAPFAAAIGELIAALPERDHLLRGSGHVGSGAAGGSLSHEQADLVTLTARARSGDKAAIKALRAKMANDGGLVAGAAFQRS